MIKRAKKVILNYIPTLVKTGVLRKAPFLYDLLEIKPSSCMAMITDRCNSRCIMCKQWRKPPKDELRTEDWKKILLQLKENGIRNIHFTGGEPLLRNDLLELISYSAENEFTIGLTTNGFLLKKNILDAFVEAGLRSIVISMDALGDNYSEIRGVQNSFRMAKEALRLVSDMRKVRQVDASINFTLMRDTVKYFQEVKQFADELSMPISICLLDKSSYIFDIKENKEKFWIEKGKDFDELIDLLEKEKRKRPASLLLNFPAIEYIRRYFDDPRQKEIPCTSSQDRIAIDPYGNFLGGCLSMGTFGNVKETSLGCLQKEKKYKIAKRNMFYKECAGCSCGYLYNIRCLPELVVKDLVKRLKFLVYKNNV